MRCPYCNDEVPLTWKRYLAAPLGKHTCPACGEAFRLKISFKYYLFSFAVSLLLGLLFLILMRMWGYAIVKMLPFYLVVCMVVVMMIDRWFDAHRRETVQIKKK